MARYELPDRIREDATQLTAMYEAKAFLPTIADVKHFLETRGRQIRGVKNRDQAFVRVIDLVLSLPPDSIHQLRNSAVHGQPARLGPISDAIGSTTHLVWDTAAAATVPVPRPVSLEIVEESGTTLLLRLSDNGDCVADTWHENVEAAKAQAAFEYGIADEDWVAAV